MKTIQYGRHEILEEDISAVVGVLRGDFLTTGPAVKDFENSFSEAVNAEHSFALTNGTAALHVIGLALNLGPRDAVIVPALTFAATANAVLYTGAKVFFADIDPKTLGICPNSAKRAIAEARQQGYTPKAIYAVHFAGLPYNLKAISELTKTNGMMLVEDACHALGASYRLNSNEKFMPVGTYADLTAWSFHPVKHIATGEGGAVTCHNADLAQKVSQYRTHGMIRDPKSFQNKELAFDSSTGLANPWYHEMQLLGFNYRMPDINAVLGNSQLKRLKTNIDSRRAVAQNYRETLSSLENVKLPPDSDELALHAYHLFCLSVDFSKLKKSRTRVMGELLEIGVGTQVHYLPVFWHPYYKNNPNLWWADAIPNASKHYEQVLSIPMYHALDRENQFHVVDALKKVLG